MGAHGPTSRLLQPGLLSPPPQATQPLLGSTDPRARAGRSGVLGSHGANRMHGKADRNCIPSLHSDGTPSTCKLTSCSSHTNTLMFVYY